MFVKWHGSMMCASTVRVFFRFLTVNEVATLLSALPSRYSTARQLLYGHRAILIAEDGCGAFIRMAAQGRKHTVHWRKWGFLSSKENPMKPDLNEAKPFFPWNKGRLVDQKAPLKLKEIWAFRIRLQL